MKKKQFIPPLSKMKDPNGVLWLDQKGTPHNSLLAEQYHKLLKQELDLDVVASNAYLVPDEAHLALQLVIQLWIVDSTLSALQIETPGDFASGSTLCDGAVTCLLRILTEKGITLPQIKCEKEENKEGLPHWLSIRSYERELYNILMIKALKDINNLIRMRFPCSNVECKFTSLERQYNTRKLVFLFRSQHDADRAKRDGILDKLLEDSYKIIQKHDVWGMMPRQKYAPPIISMDQYSGEKLFYLLRD